jgi:uncharacterized SAM-binding protein YcdF (DUF218 family)
MKDAVIVLSHRLEKNGKPSEEYQKRLAKAMQMLSQNIARNIILCSETANPDIRDHLIKNGIAESRIFLQTKSKDTIGEAFFSKKIALSKGWKNLAVVSSDYHLRYRAALIFDFIFGDKFSIEYLGVNSGRLRDAKTIKNQIDSLNMFLKLFEGIPPSEDKCIKSRIETKHALYS